MTARRIPLRYPAVCRRCGTDLPAGTTAAWEPSTKATTCLSCPGGPAAPPPPERARPPGRPGADRVPVDPDADPRWDALLRYHLACVRRAGAARPVPVGNRQDWTLLAAERADLVTGEADDVPVEEPLLALFSRAAGNGAVFCGWPVVVVPDGKRVLTIAPLVLTELQPPAEGAVSAVAADERPHLNTALVSADHFAADAVAAALAAAEGLTFGDADALTATLREVLAALGLDGTALDPRHLSTPGEPLGPGVHNVAMAFVGVSDAATRRLADELTVLRRRTDWTSTAARYLLHPAPTVQLDDLPAPAAPLALNASQEVALTASGAAQVTAVTGPPGTGKSQLVAAIVAGAWLRGETVLVASTNNQAVRAAVDKAHAVDDGTLVRTGNREWREALPGALRYLAARPEPSGASPEVAQRRLEVAIRHRSALHDRLAARAALEAELAQLAQDLEVQRSLLWNAPGRSPVHDRRAELAGRARRADRAWWFREFRARRALQAAEVPPGRPVGVADLAAWAAAELRWDEARRQLSELPARNEAAERAELAAADEEWAAASTEAVRQAVAARLAAGRTALRQLADLRPGAGSARAAAVAATVPYAAGWACTTLSAAANFPLTAGLFDLVVVDEASQCSVADVIPIAYRARRIVVVGDPNQLAPVVTVSGQELAAVARSVGTDDDAMHDQRVSYGRDSAFSGFAHHTDRPPHLLAEHYRCHPEIARYVNDVFYGGALRVLTDPGAAADGVQGLHWVQVEGRTGAGPRSGAVNEAEVHAVVRWVLDHPDEDGTLGVVTPFTAQADLIRHALTRALGAETCAAREVVVGTAHALQGDERDLVLFSTVLSAGARPGTARWVESQRNLVNVAVSRAKRALVVVGDAGALAGLPVPALHALAAAAHRDRTVATPDLREDPRLHSEAERRLFAALRSIGVEVVAKPVESGYELDFAVRRGDGRRLDVECDGTQHVDPRGRQRRQDLARDRVLEGLGWQVVRVPAWRCLTEPDLVAAEIAG